MLELEVTEMTRCTRLLFPAPNLSTVVPQLWGLWMGCLPWWEPLARLLTSIPALAMFRWLGWSGRA